MRRPLTETSSVDAPVVNVKAARLAFGDEVLFDDLDFTLAAGRWTCVLGPSGVGKSSLLRLVAGLAPATPPTRVTCGDDGASLTGQAVYMAQQDLLMPWLSLQENVSIGARLRGNRRRRAADAERGRAVAGPRGRRAARVA